MSDYTSHLFPYLPPSQITTLSCGHVIPKSNLIAWNVSFGPSGKGAGDFEFTFKNKSDGGMMDELGRAILNLSTIVPDGIVVFFPSYAYLEAVTRRWTRAAAEQGGKSIWERLEGKKALFRESKEASVDDVLRKYGQAIDSGKGGLLFSVVGGKMSEGINFSDRLGRCVIIVGLPFPNIMSAEWRAKIEYIESSTTLRLEATAASEVVVQGDGGAAGTAMKAPKLTKEEIQKLAKEAGREFYENACMRAVNQSVGRAIRHREDYAAILMIDRRFGSERVRNKLPGWIREGLVADAGEKSFGQLMGAVSAFIRAKKTG
jgi:chromosome transmission fidelity protein 1